MQPSEILTPQTGQESTQATEPKDKKQFDHLQYGLDEIQKAVNSYPVECRPELLKTALEQTTEHKSAVERIVEIEQEIRRACDALLDSKARASIALLSELSSLSSVSNFGGDYAMDFLHGEYGQKDVEKAREQFPDDSNVAFLKHVFDLAHSVVKTDDRIFLQKVAEEGTAIKEQDTEPDEPQPQTEDESGTEDDEPEDDESQLVEGPTPLTAIQNWLAKRTYSDKLTAILLWQLLNKESIWEDEGYCEKHFGNNLFKQYEQTVVDASQDKEYLSSADPEEIAVTAMTTALLPMHV